MKQQLLNKIISKSPHLSWMNDNTVFIAKHGSVAYGTNIEGSDEDYKGITIPPKQYYLGNINKFEQAEFNDPDMVIYEISKFFSLASSCNPNIIELLFTDPSDHIYVSPIGEEILNIKDKFLSKRIKHTFSGYAFAQLSRIKTHRRWILQPVEAHPTRAEMGLQETTLIPQDQLLAAQSMIKKEMEKFNFDFLDDVEEATKIKLKETVENMMVDLKVSKDDLWMSCGKKIGFDDNFLSLLQKEREYSDKKKEFDNYQNWKKTRNPKRAADEEKFGFDLKHAYHLVRLMRMAKEILTTGKVIVKRPDREELLTIRAGAWTYDQLIDYATNLEKEINEIYLTSSVLPHKPDLNYLDEVCIKLIESII